MSLRKLNFTFSTFYYCITEFHVQRMWKVDCKARCPVIHRTGAVQVIDRVFLLCYFIIWLQQYARTDWLLSGQDFLVMTGHYENFSRLDGF